MATRRPETRLSPRTAPRPAPVEICIEDVHKSFEATPVLRGIDLVVHAGDVLAIVGGSGCGKTVLLNHVLGKLRPDRGRVLAADHGAPGAPVRDLAAMDEDALERVYAHWGVVFQRNALFSGTVLENLTLWLLEVKRLGESNAEAIARDVLESVMLPSDDEFLARDPEKLSGGMAKRLAIARALAMDPVVLFYDEPTTGLDPASAATIHDLIFDTHHERRRDGVHHTSVIITHDKELLKRLHPRTVLLHDGQIHFDGSYREFRASRSPQVAPYLRMMPVLHQRERHGV